MSPAPIERQPRQGVCAVPEEIESLALNDFQELLIGQAGQ